MLYNTFACRIFLGYYLFVLKNLSDKNMVRIENNTIIITNIMQYTHYKKYIDLHASYLELVTLSESESTRGLIPNHDCRHE